MQELAPESLCSYPLCSKAEEGEGKGFLEGSQLEGTPRIQGQRAQREEPEGEAEEDLGGCLRESALCARGDRYFNQESDHQLFPR